MDLDVLVQDLGLSDFGVGFFQWIWKGSLQDLDTLFFGIGIQGFSTD